MNPRFNWFGTESTYRDPWNVEIGNTCKFAKSVVTVGVDIAIGHGLDGRGTIPGTDKMFLFSVASRPALGPNQLPKQWIQGHFLRRKSAAV
jgi:hypothetical protein